MRDLAICGSLDSGELREFRRLGCCVELRVGQSLVRQGDEPLSVFTVTQGALKSFEILPDGRRQVTGFHLPGDFIGAAGDEPYSAGIDALEDSRVCAFPLRRFDDFVGDHRSLERELYVVAARSLAQAKRQMVLLGRMTAVERMASFLLALSERRQGTDVLELPMTRSDIADYLGLTKETISRLLAELKGSRLIRLQSVDRIEILDRPRLEAVAAGR